MMDQFYGLGLVNKASQQEKWGSLLSKGGEIKPSMSCKTSSTCRAALLNAKLCLKTARLLMQIMWVSVLTARQQLLWEFSNVCVVKKTTTTIGSQRMQFALLPRVFTIWWKRCRWIFTNHRCLRHSLGWTRGNSTNFTGRE